MRTFWLTGSSSGQPWWMPWWMLSWGSNANFLHCSNLLGNVGCNHKIRRQKSQAPLRNQFITQLPPCLRRTSLKWCVFSCGKQPCSRLVFAFSFENLMLMQSLRTKSLKKWCFQSHFLSVTLILWMHILAKPCCGEELFQIIPKLRIDW